MPVRERSDRALTPFSIAGDPVSVRPFEPGDLALIEEASTDEMICRTTTVPRAYSEDAGRAFIERQHTRAATGFGWSMAIVTAERAVGQIGLWLANLHHGRAEIGYWVAPSARGQACAAAAVDLVSDWAFDHLDVHRLGLFIEPLNVGSIRTAERAGYEREALLRQWQVVDDEPRDMYSYVRLRA